MHSFRVNRQLVMEIFKSCLPKCCLRGLREKTFTDLVYRIQSVVKVNLNLSVILQKMNSKSFYIYHSLSHSFFMLNLLSNHQCPISKLFSLLFINLLEVFRMSHVYPAVYLCRQKLFIIVILSLSSAFYSFFIK